MYNKTSMDFAKVFEVVIKYRKKYKSNQSRWVHIAKELNKYFSTDLTPKQWKSQFDSASKRMRKYGEPGIRIGKERIKDVRVVSTKDSIDILRNFLTKSKTIDEITEKLGVDEIRALGLIQRLKLDHYIITYNKFEKTYIIDRKPVIEIKEYNHSIGDVKEFEFMVISDTHWCGKNQQKSFLEYLYKLAVERGITTVYHAGDIVDGYYKNRPEHIFELFLIGADEQKDYVVKNWPKHPGITTYLIIGNHDETHIKNGGFNIGRALEIERSDFKYLGIGHARIWLTPNCSMDLLHPLDGSSYAISYSGQKYMDSISGGDKPNMIFTGHHHKALYFPYRNIHYFEVPSITKQSSWMKRKRIANESGAWIVKVKVDEQGSITNLSKEYIKQYVLLDNDY